MSSFTPCMVIITSLSGLHTCLTLKPPQLCKPAPARAPPHVFCALRSPSKANDCSTVFSPAFAHPSPDSSPPPHFSRSTREYTSGAIRCTRGARARARYSDRTPCYYATAQRPHALTLPHARHTPQHIQTPPTHTLPRTLRAHPPFYAAHRTYAMRSTSSPFFPSLLLFIP